MSQASNLKTTALFALLVFNCTAYADNSFRQEKLYIKADTTDYNYKSGKNIFTGHVKVDQGNNHITADKLVTKRNRFHQINEAIAYGSATKAHYWTDAIGNQREVHAYAKIIKLYPMQSNILLEGSVLVQQDANRFEGEQIIFNKKDQTITVPQSETGRTVLTYNPDN